jgi:hypothetical protein
MRFLVSGIAILSLFLMAISLPLLHLHPALENDLGALIHCHMPDPADNHHAGAASGRILDDADSAEPREVPFEISALAAAASAQPPAPELSAVLATLQHIESDRGTVSFIEPDPRAQPPPGTLLHLSLRSPPA